MSLSSVSLKSTSAYFNGNGYDDTWIAEAKKRGLLNLKTTPDCIPYFIKDKNIKLFTEHRVFSKEEMLSRYEILLEGYCKVINIEALTMADMARRDILPAVSSFIIKLSETAKTKKEVAPDMDCSYETETAKALSALMSCAYRGVGKLESAVMDAKEIGDVSLLANHCKDVIFAAMNELRIAVDEMETLTDSAFWPLPSYGDMLFSVK